MASNFKYITVCDLCPFMPDIQTTESTAAASVEAVLTFIDAKQDTDGFGSTLDNCLAALDSRVLIKEIPYGQVTRAIYAGNPVIAELHVFDTFNNEEHATGQLLESTNATTPSVQTTCLTGYDEQGAVFYARHNRGINFGFSGYYHVSYDYVKKYGLRFLTILPHVVITDTPIVAPTLPKEVAPKLSSAKLDAALALEFRQAELAKIRSILMILFKNSTVGHYDVFMTHVNSYLKALFDRIKKHVEE